MGGQAGDVFGIISPFEIALGLMLISTWFSACSLPYIPTTSSLELLGNGNGISSMLAPIKIFTPQSFRLSNDKKTKHYGVLFLGLGVFFAVLATGFIPVLFQMYATTAYQFRSAENGYLMCFFSLTRGLFLSFAFPKVIASGRRKYSSTARMITKDSSDSIVIPVAPKDFEAISALQGEQEPATLLKPSPAGEDVTFDLLFLKWSLVVDGILTGATAFSTTGWHIYLAAFLIPLASGSSSAAKGVMMAMTPKRQNADALTAITLVEMIGNMSASKLPNFMHTRSDTNQECSKRFRTDILNIR